MRRTRQLVGNLREVSHGCILADESQFSQFTEARRKVLGKSWGLDTFSLRSSRPEGRSWRRPLKALNQVC